MLKAASLQNATAPEKLLTLSGRLKYFTGTSHQILKVFHRPKFAQKKVLFHREALQSGPKKQPKPKVFGRDIPGTSGTQTSGYPIQKQFASGLFLLFWAGSGRDVQGFGSGRPGFGKTLCKKILG